MICQGGQKVLAGDSSKHCIPHRDRGYRGYHDWKPSWHGDRQPYQEGYQRHHEYRGWQTTWALDEPLLRLLRLHLLLRGDGCHCRVLHLLLGPPPQQRPAAEPKAGKMSRLQ